MTEQPFELVPLESLSSFRLRFPAYESEIESILKESCYAPTLESVRQFLQTACESNAQVGERRFFFALALEKANNLLGFCQFRLVGADADLDYVAVGADFRRRGCANELLKMSLTELKCSGAERVILEVGASNNGAIQLYGRLGFRQIGIRSKYYKTGEDALVMELVF